MKTLILAAATLALFVSTGDAAFADGHARFARQNGAGGVTAGGAHNSQGPNGGRRVGAHGIKTDGQGNAVGGSAGCASGAAGSGCRQGSFNRNADGSASHQGSGSFTGANGASGSTQGSFTKNADGTASGERSTTASGANGTYNGETTYSSGSGLSHSATCTDASGASVACPTR